MEVEAKGATEGEGEVEDEAIGEGEGEVRLSKVCLRVYKDCPEVEVIRQSDLRERFDTVSVRFSVRDY